jgi:hypothetical protein
VRNRPSPPDVFQTDAINMPDKNDEDRRSGSGKKDGPKKGGRGWRHHRGSRLDQREEELLAMDAGGPACRLTSQLPSSAASRSRSTLMT